MKSLLLLRHAQSADKQMGQGDFHRVLTATGEAQASRIGAYLNTNSILPDIILCSTAVRALSTAIILSEQLNYAPAKIIKLETIYEASINSILIVIKAIEDQFNRVLLVGHNPSVSSLSEFLTDEHVGNIDPAGLVSIEFNLSSWKEAVRSSGKLVTITNV